MSYLDTQLSKAPPPIQLLIFTLLSIFLGFIDLKTGIEINFFIFYGLPIWLTTWYLGEKKGIYIAILCLAIWFTQDFISTKIYTNPFAPFWNGGIRFIFFLFIIYSLKNIRQKLLLEELNADFDALTGILNTRGFKERLEILFPFLSRNKQLYIIAFIDLDNFKKLNDTQGHSEGDKALKTVSTIMTQSLRKSDLVGRLGGDEFVLFLSNIDIEDAEKIITQMKEELDIAMKNFDWPIGFSIGVCAFDSQQTTPEAAIKYADELMYEVKSAGKGTASYKKHF